MLDVVLKVTDNGRIGVELLDLRVDLRRSGADIDAAPSQKDELTTTIVIVVVSQRGEDPKPMFPSLVHATVHRV